MVCRIRIKIYFLLNQNERDIIFDDPDTLENKIKIYDRK